MRVCFTQALNKAALRSLSMHRLAAIRTQFKAP
jgi:hypothetical protein